MYNKTLNKCLPHIRYSLYFFRLIYQTHASKMLTKYRSPLLCAKNFQATALYKFARHASLAQPGDVRQCMHVSQRETLVIILEL